MLLWLKMHRVAILRQRAMSQLLSPAPSGESEHWAADAVAYTNISSSKSNSISSSSSSSSGPWNPVCVFLHHGSFFLVLTLFFCPAYHLLSVPTKTQPSAKYGSTFSSYSSSTVSALWSTGQLAGYSTDSCWWCWWRSAVPFISIILTRQSSECFSQFLLSSHQEAPCSSQVWFAGVEPPPGSSRNDPDTLVIQMVVVRNCFQVKVRRLQSWSLDVDCSGFYLQSMR